MAVKDGINTAQVFHQFSPVLTGVKLVNSHVLFVGLTVRKPEKLLPRKA